jgi:hypothetical protein
MIRGIIIFMKVPLDNRFYLSHLEVSNNLALSIKILSIFIIFQYPHSFQAELF